MSKKIKLTIVYEHPVNEVWEALTDQAAVSEWLMPCNIEPVVGHRFQFRTKPAPGFNGIVDCEVLEVIPGRKLVYTWSGGSLKDTIVSFGLKPLGDKTELSFEHSGFEGFFNRILVSRILSHGWRRKILPVLLTQYLGKNERRI